MIFVLICTVLAIGVYHFYPLYRKGLQRVGNHPGFRSLISPFSMAGFGTPYIPGVYPGFDMPWKGKHNLFAEWGSDVITCVSWTGRSIIYLADADLVQKVNGNAHSFPKPVEEYTVLNFFGPNLVTASGHNWRRQQKVSKDVFNLDGWKFLWDETRDIYGSMMEANGWTDIPEGTKVPVNHAVDITLRVALLAIANAGFGMSMRWRDDMEKVLTPGHTVSFQSALHTVAQSSILKMALPEFAYHLPIPKLKKVRTAFTELELYIQEMIQERKGAILGSMTGDRAGQSQEERHDLFNNLIKASLQGDEPLTDAELQGNIYIYLLAGHETTAHSIAFTLALLSLWPDVQEKLYQHIISVMPEDGITSYDHYAKFTYVLAVYLETLRMFPPVQQIPKTLAKDTMFVFDKTNEHNVAYGLQEQKQKQLRREQPYATPPPSPTRPGGGPSSPPTGTSEETGWTLDAGASSESLGSTPTPEIDQGPTLPGAFPASALPSRKLRKPINLSPPSRMKADCKPLSDSGFGLVAQPEQTTVIMEEGTIVFISPPAVHYNPKYYPEPYEFKPERFMGVFDSKNFIPFSSGTRVCLGRHFSEVESVCFIAHMMRDWSVHPVPAFEGETREQMVERMFKAIPLITLTPLSIPLEFRRR